MQEKPITAVEKSSVILIVITFLLQGCLACENDIFQTIHSPDQKFSAVIFNRDCGATTGFSTQVSIVDFGESLPKVNGNTLVIDNHPSKTKVKVEWVSNNELVISSLGKNIVYDKENSFGKVKINYE